MNRPAPLVLDLDCRLEASRERVFDALTLPDALARWWGPSGFSLPEVELDLRVGGRYRFGMQPPDGELFHLGGEFIEIERPGRLGYTFRYEEPDADDRETAVRLTLAPAGAGTELSLEQGEFATEPRLELHRRGWTESLERLRAFLGTRG